MNTCKSKGIVITLGFSPVQRFLSLCATQVVHGLNPCIDRIFCEFQFSVFQFLASSIQNIGPQLVDPWLGAHGSLKASSTQVGLDKSGWLQKMYCYCKVVSVSVVTGACPLTHIVEEG